MLPPVPLHFSARGGFAEIDQLVGQTVQAHRLSERGLRRDTYVEMLQPGGPGTKRIDVGQKLCFCDRNTFGVLVRQGECH